MAQGAVQGVGFRPFVYQLAADCGLAGWVRNDAAGLALEVEGPAHSVDRFLQRFDEERPSAAMILVREASWLEPRGYADFRILASDAAQEKSAGILPDLATCAECRAEFSTPGERRHLYPFTNCTQCGPRYTILRAIPYDRPNTTMAGFTLCAGCRREYTDPRDRRFHAQPIACPVCGPRLERPLAEAAEDLRAGRIVALKGVGGYQLLADARNAAAVERLRDRKGREAKPFAVMTADLDAARLLAGIDEEEARLLLSPAAPIVLLKARDGHGLAHEVCGASPYVGLMLAYSPLHHLLLREFPHPVVATSGNRSDEPICIDNGEARARLGDIADAFLDHNRPVERPCDDSVTRLQRGRETLIRRARGYAPLPVWIGRPLPRILAVGGHLKNTVALALGRQVVVSQHIGDLETWEARQAFERTIADLCRLYEFNPEMIACDLHPDYASTRWARAQGLPVVAVQHHEAHAAAVAAENDIDGAFLGVSWDGTGYGHDGAIWGSEFFLCENGRRERVAHLKPFRLPGGEAAVKQCWRVAASLRHAMGLECDTRVRPLLEKGLNSPWTTSMGRLFDAVASLTGVCEANRFEGESGLRLEAIAGAGDPYELEGFFAAGDWRELVDAVLGERDAATASARFHATLAEWIVRAARRCGVRQLALSGGCFLNARLVELTCRRAQDAGLRVFTHQRVPPNDGGLALGQVYAAAGY
jgi:hydrogenase maturation protein HypF